MGSGLPLEGLAIAARNQTCIEHPGSAPTPTASRDRCLVIISWLFVVLVRQRGASGWRVADACGRLVPMACSAAANRPADVRGHWGRGDPGLALHVPVGLLLRRPPTS